MEEDYSTIVKQAIDDYEIPLIRYATRILRNQENARDIVQDAFIKFVKHLQSDKDDISNLSAWLYRVTHNLALDFIRKHSRITDIDDEVIEDVMATDTHTPANSLGTRDAEATAWTAMKDLSEREQQIITLKVIEEKSYQEIADVLEITSSNVGFILHTALKKLQKEMIQKLA